MKRIFPRNLFLLMVLSCVVANAQDRNRDTVLDYQGTKLLPVHWLLSVTDQGRTVVLEDGSVWRVCPHCASTVARWFPITPVEIADRGGTHHYRYSITVAIDRHVGHSVHAICVQNPRSGEIHTN